MPQPRANVEQTVRVTIGRVEVRAVFPPAPAKPAAPQGPKPLSLAEYLRERDRQ